MKNRKKMDIIYEDKELLVVNKPPSLLTIATEKEGVRTLYHQAREYVKKQNPKNKIFIVHRLDKDTSGIVLFVKSEKLKRKLQDSWNEVAYLREYIAIVEGKVLKNGVLSSYLKEDKTGRVYPSKNGKFAITEYEVLGCTKAYSLLKIQIKTGRKNQIRVQLSEAGHPIIGDKKYGAHKNPLSRMGLHASKLGVIIDQYDRVWTSCIPREFANIFKEEVLKYNEKDL